jgi:hypothetical protein
MPQDLVLLHATGGKLDISKCKYVIFDGSDTLPETEQPIACPISIPDQENGNRIPSMQSAHPLHTSSSEDICHSTETTNIKLLRFTKNA